MAKFNNKDRDAGRGRFKGKPSSFGRKPSFGGRRDGERPELFEVQCSDCGKDTKVPFRPTGDRPVYCRDCFAKHGGGEELGRQAGERGARPSVSSINTIEIKRELEQINAKLEKLLSKWETKK